MQAAFEAIASSRYLSSSGSTTALILTIGSIIKLWSLKVEKMASRFFKERYLSNVGRANRVENSKNVVGERTNIPICIAFSRAARLMDFGMRCALINALQSKT